MVDNEVWKWGAASIAAIGAFLLRHSIFDQLRDQDQTLARIDERTARWCK